jgi:hypothetical protein
MPTNFFSDSTKSLWDGCESNSAAKPRVQYLTCQLSFFWDIFGHSPESQGVFANCLQAEPTDNRVEE